MSDFIQFIEARGRSAGQSWEKSPDRDMFRSACLIKFTTSQQEEYVGLIIPDGKNNKLFVPLCDDPDYYAINKTGFRNVWNARGLKQDENVSDYVIRSLGLCQGGNVNGLKSYAWSYGFVTGIEIEASDQFMSPNRFVNSLSKRLTDAKVCRVTINPTSKGY